MSYVGLVPGSLWIWQPTQVDLADEFRTLVTEFETGWEQRRAKWNRPKATVTYRFDRGTLTPDDIGDIWRFYKVQQGAFRTFDLPIFGRVTTIASTYAGGFAVGLADTKDFTSSVDSRWNKFLSLNFSDQRDLFVVNSVVTATHVMVQSAGANIHDIDVPIFPVIKARFAQDLYSPTYLVALAATYGVQFTEVRS